MARITTKITSIDPETGDTDTLDLTDQINPPARDDIYTRPQASAPSNNTPDDAPNFRWIWIVGTIAILAWLAVSAYLIFSVLKLGANAQSYSALEWAGIATMVLGPALLIFVAAYSLKQLARLSSQSNRLAHIADALTRPDETVIGKSKIMATAINKQVDDVNEKLNKALGRLSSLEDVLKTQVSALAASNVEATQTAGQIANSVTKQGEALSNISGTFDERMGGLSEMISSHSTKLADATHTAEQKIKEARISVEGATAKINSASDIVRSNTLEASATLNASHADISSLGDIIGQRSDELDSVYKKHAGDLTQMIEHLRDEQQNLGAILEERLTKMRDLSLSAQASAESLSDASQAGRQTVEALAESASLADSAVKARFKDMQDMVKYSSEHAESISDKAAQRVKDSLEHTRKEIARIERDMMELQTRVGQTNHKSLELVPEDIVDDGPEFPKKRRWSRLKLKPILDDIPAEPEPEPEAKPELEPEPEPVTASEEPENAEDSLELYLEPDEPPAEEPKEVDAFYDAIRPSVPREPQKKPKKEKQPGSGFSLRGLFGGSGSAAPDASLSIVGAHDDGLDIPPMTTPTSDPETDILAALAELGLAPNVVVDDGCIIEAANSRTASGHDAMSKIVGARLGGPVAHLSKALSLDDDLSAKTIAFATQYDQIIESLAGNREAIRTNLEGEKGRAYLLCDAALNLGRV